MSPNLNQNYITTDLLQELNLSLNNAYLYFSKKEKKGILFGCILFSFDCFEYNDFNALVLNFNLFWS